MLYLIGIVIDPYKGRIRLRFAELSNPTPVGYISFSYKNTRCVTDSVDFLTLGTDYRGLNLAGDVD